MTAQRKTTRPVSKTGKPSSGGVSGRATKKKSTKKKSSVTPAANSAGASDDRTSSEPTDEEVAAAGAKGSEYFANWWAERGDDIRLQRRERYQADPKFREKSLERARRYRAEVRDGERVPTPNHGRVQFVEVNGERMEAFAVATLAQTIGRSVACVNYWKAHELLPDSPIENTRGVSLYTEEMITVVDTVLDSRSKRRLKRGDEEFFAQVMKGWKKLGLYRAKAGIKMVA